MNIFKVDVDGHTFFLAGCEAMANFKTLVLRAIRNGGDFIEVLTATDKAMTLLISSGSSVSLEPTGSDGEVGHASAFSDDDLTDELSNYLSDYADFAAA
jgi:hypothetical protein